MNREIQKTLRNDLGARRIDSIIKIRNMIIWTNSEARVLLANNSSKIRFDEKRRAKFVRINSAIKDMEFDDCEPIAEEKYEQLRAELLKE